MAVPLVPIYRQAMEVDSNTASGMEAKSAVRSCTTCSKAKAKCVKRPGQHICERCGRLGKECHSREPVLRRRKTAKTTRAAQLEKLESKIEHLVNAISTTQAPRGFGVNFGQPSPPISQVSERSSSQHRTNEILDSLCPEDVPNGSSNSSASNTPTTSLNFTNSHNSLIESPVSGHADYQCLGVSMSEAEVLLDRYQRLMARGNPFVVIPAKATAQQLFAERPLLLQAIVVVAYFHDLPRQQILVKHLMRNISERVLMNNEKSIEILQGILVFVTWYHPHIFWAQQVTNLLHLAIAMTIDLGIDRPPQNCGDFKHGTIKAVHGQSLAPRVPNMDEHRVLAGCFYLTSMLASSFKKIDAMPWTKHLDNGLRIIEQSAEIDSDLFLVQITRLQHLIEESSTMESQSAPMSMYVKAFNVDIDRLRQNDKCKDPNNTFLRMQYMTSEILVWELSLTDLQDNKRTPLRSHLEDLYQLVKAISAFLDVYFSIPISEYLTVPFSTYAQFAHTFIVLIKIASLEIDGWDMKAIHEDLNFSTVIEEAANRFEGATQSAPDGLKVNNECFTKWAQRVRWMKQVYEAKFMPEEIKGHEQSEAIRAQLNQDPPEIIGDYAASGAQQQPTPPDDVLSGDFFNYLDENFWQSFAGDFDLGFPEMNMT